MADESPLPLTESTVVAAPGGCVSSSLSGEVTALHVGTGMYYGLNELGARIWELLQTPRRVGTIRVELQKEFDMDTRTCLEELILILNDLRAAGLVEIRGSSEG